MNQTTYDAEVASLSLTKREILRCARERGGRFCVPDVYRNRVQDGQQPGHGRYQVAGDGMKPEMADLQSRGLLRAVGEEPQAGRRQRAMHYVVVEPADVEQVRDSYEPPAKRRKKPRRSAAAKLRDLKPKRESGDFEAWLRTRRSILSLAGTLQVQLPKQVLWEAIPDEDLVLIAEDIADLYDALAKGVKLIQLRCDSDDLQSKIDKALAGTEPGDPRGRFKAEAEVARTMAERLRRKHEALYG